MTSLIEAALSRSRTVLSLLVLLLVAGAYAYVAIPKEADPDVTIPIIYTQVHLDGISPEDAERLLARPLEQELRGIEGVKEMRSISHQGGASVILEFEAGFDADAARLDVREKVDQAKSDLPADADEPTVNEVNLSLFPVLVVTLSGPVPERTLLALSRDLRRDLESLTPVLEANITGDRDELVELIVDPMTLESYGIDAQQVLQAVDRSNLLVAAGALDTGDGRYSIKVPGLFTSPQDILDMPVKVAGDSVVTFRDIGTLHRSFKDPETLARINGERGIALEISKRAGENIIDTVAQVRQAVEAKRANWPETVHVTYSQDKSANIATMLTDLQNNVMAAIVLVMIVIVAALGLRSAGYVGLAIPGAFLTGLLVLFLAGLTVNVVVLFSLILAVGILVDGAIVVVEYADRKLREGLPPREAYRLAATRMAWPITAATATTLAAFFPLLFWPGTVGEFMKFLPITLLAVLTASLAMALIFIPTLGSVLGRKAAKAEQEDSNVQALAAGSRSDLTRLSGATGAYLRLLDRALRHPAKILLGAFVVLVAVYAAYGQFGRGIEFFPEVEPDNAVLQIHARGNLSIYERDRLVNEVEQRVLELHQETGEFHAVYARAQLTSGQQREEAEDIIGTIQLELVDWWSRRPAHEILADIRARTGDLAGIRVESEREQMGPPTGKPIHIEMASDDIAALESATGMVASRLRGDRELTDIEDSRPIPGVEWELAVDRAQAAKFGADVAMVGSYVRMVTNGLNIGAYRVADADEEIDIVVRFPRDRRSLDRLDGIRMKTDFGSVPLSSFVERTAQPKTQQIRRTDSRRVMSVKADVAPGVLADDKVRELRQWLTPEALPQGVSVTFRGEDEERQESQGFLVKAFAVALFAMAVILVTQFNSFYSAFLILSAVILSTVGVLVGLLLTGQPFGVVMSGIGVIALAGIVVNNNIVLIDTFDRLRQSEPDVRQAILRTGAQRLRPVALTTITTMLGLMPMVFGVNIDLLNRFVQMGAPATGLWQQLSTAIVFGLGFSTLLTLIVTPCALMLRGNVAAWRQGGRAQSRRHKGQADSGDGTPASLPQAAE